MSLPVLAAIAGPAARPLRVMQALWPAVQHPAPLPAAGAGAGRAAGAGPGAGAVKQHMTTACRLPGQLVQLQLEASLLSSAGLLLQGACARAMLPSCFVEI
jgi:hypothetical protein